MSLGKAEIRTLESSRTSDTLWKAVPCRLSPLPTALQLHCAHPPWVSGPKAIPLREVRGKDLTHVGADLPAALPPACHSSAPQEGDFTVQQDVMHGTILVPSWALPQAFQQNELR